MEDSVHMYEIVGQCRPGQATVKECTGASGKTQAYALPSRAFQERHNEYQELQIHPIITHPNQNRNSSHGSAGHKDSEQNNHSEECFEIKDNIKKLKRCICTLSLLFALLLLITAAAVILAVLGFNNKVKVANDPSAQQGSAGISEETESNLILQLTAINQTLFLSMEMTQNQIQNVRNKINENDQNISTVVDTLEARINERLNNLQTNINNLQTMSQSQLTTVDNSLRRMIADLETRLQSASYQNITSLRAMVATINAQVTTLQSSTDTHISRLQNRIDNIVRNVSALQANQLVQPGIVIHVHRIRCNFSRNSLILHYHNMLSRKRVHGRST